MLVGATIAGMADGDPARWADIAALTALVMAGMCVLAWLLRLSSLVNFISETILLGFKAGAALTIAMTQLPKLFGVPGGGEHFFERIASSPASSPTPTSPCSPSVWSALALLLPARSCFPAGPSRCRRGAVDRRVVGDFAGGARLQRLSARCRRACRTSSAPELRLRDVDGVIPLAFACLLLAYVESVSAARRWRRARLRDRSAPGTARAGRSESGRGIRPGLPGRGRPVAVVGERQGRREDAARAGVRLGDDRAVPDLLTGLLSNLPNVVLAAIVLVAVKGLIDIGELRHVWRVSRFEFSVSMVGFRRRAAAGHPEGRDGRRRVSLVLLIGARRSARGLSRSHPRHAGSSDLERHPDNEAVPGR